MTALLGLCLMLGTLWAIKAFTEWACPPAGRIIDVVTRTLISLVWSLPVRHFGAGPTILGFSLLFAVCSTVVSLANPRGGSFFGTLFLWSLVYLVWRFLRWRADRQFQPRPLPHRERRGER